MKYARAPIELDNLQPPPAPPAPPPPPPSSSSLYRRDTVLVAPRPELASAIKSPNRTAPLNNNSNNNNNGVSDNDDDDGNDDSNNENDDEQGKHLKDLQEKVLIAVAFHINTNLC